jgi:hypothetical protein
MVVRILLLVGFLLLVVAVANRVDERLLEYKSLLRQRDALEREKRALLLEDGYARSGAVYLVMDLQARTVAAKMAGVPLRKTEITWLYGRPGATAVFDTFRIASVRVDSARADTMAVTAQPKATPDSLRRDSLSARIDSLLASGAEGGGSDTLEHFHRYRLALQRGPRLWLATLPPDSSHWDSVKTCFRLWFETLPNVLKSSDLYLFVPPGDAAWIAATAQLDSVRVDSAGAKAKPSAKTEPERAGRGGPPPPQPAARPPTTPGVGLLVLPSP